MIDVSTYYTFVIVSKEWAIVITNTPRKSSAVGHRRGLEVVNEGWDRLFVKISAIWNLEGTCLICKSSLHTNSQTKWISMSICQDHLGVTGLWVMKIALVLSQNNVGGLGMWMCKSWKIFKSHLTSIAVRARAWYLDSAVDQDTVSYFLAVQKIKLLPRKIAYPEVDRHVLEQLAQYA